jgi:hypothetical protein
MMWIYSNSSLGGHGGSLALLIYIFFIIISSKLNELKMMRPRHGSRQSSTWHMLPR